MYPTDWHTEYGQQTEVSARKILSYITKNFPIASSVEIGCGDGHWSIEAQKLGINNILGIDGPWTDRKTLKLSASHFLERDFTQALLLERKFDLAICLEVAEHVTTGSAERFVDSLVAASDLQLFGAAIPLQGGAGHINEQWPSWWREKFAERGFISFDFIRPAFWNDKSIHYWYRQNTLVYIKATRSDLISIAETLQSEAARESPIIDIVHPEKFYSTASYESIQFKSLFRKLPRKLMERARRAIKNI